MPSISRRMRFSLYALAIGIGAWLAALLSVHQAERRGQEENARRGMQQLGLYANNLQTLIARYRSLPAVLALDPQVREALGKPIDDATQAQLNVRLEAANDAAQSSVLELLDRNGMAVAASNWQLPSTYVGHNYAFRPYFQDSRDKGTGRFYAVGVTSGIAGYFLSQAVLDDNGRFIGSMVVKLESDRFEQEWQNSPDLLLASDARGVVFLANSPRWRYRLLQPLSMVARTELATTRQYDQQALTEITTRSLAELAPDSSLRRVEGPDGNSDYLWESLALPEENWTLHLLHPAAIAPADIRNAALTGIGLWLAFIFLGLFLQQRWLVTRLLRRNHAELEHLVEQRTEALRTAQDGLVQSAKLAALGHMSAALAEEINQPLTAQRMHLANLEGFLEQGRFEEARQALQPLDQQLARMTALMTHLNTFAQESPVGTNERLDLAQTVDQALLLMQPRLREGEVFCELSLARPAWVMGDPIRLEQVVLNLLRNALDAMLDKSLRQLQIELTAQAGDWHLCIDDTGGGIATENLPEVFNPFFTTKSAGTGLGLAVSYGIVQDAGGRLTVENRSSGARFTLILPIADEFDA